MRSEIVRLLSPHADAVTLLENIRVGSAIYDANATDPDAGVPGDLRYVIIGGNLGDAVFIIDHVSGDVSVGSLLDYDAAPQSYALSINVTDNFGGVPVLIDVMSLTVTLLDVNDNVPMFTQNTYAVAAIDADSGVDGNTGDSVKRGDGGAVRHRHRYQHFACCQQRLRTEAGRIEHWVIVVEIGNCYFHDIK